MFRVETVILDLLSVSVQFFVIIIYKVKWYGNSFDDSNIFLLRTCLVIKINKRIKRIEP